MTLKLNTHNLFIAQARACLSNNDLARESGLSRSGLLQIISGKRNPKPDTVGKIAIALKVDPEFLIEEEVKNYAAN